MSLAKLTTTEVIEKKKVPDQVILELNLETAIALQAVMYRVTHSNNYIRNIYESLFDILGPFDVGYMFENGKVLDMTHSSMAICNKEAARIRREKTFQSPMD